MKSPSEKAKELVMKFYDLQPSMDINLAKESTKLCVYEIIEVIKFISEGDEIPYWSNVKNEIENL